MKIIKYFNKQLKNLNIWDIALVKLSVLTFTLWILTFLPIVNSYLTSINHYWYLGAFILVMIKPTKKLFIK